MKKILSFLAVLALLTALCVPALAAEPELGCVTDAASLLSDQQWATLEGKAEALSAQYECGMYIITLDDFTDYDNTNDVYEAAKAIYREYSLGWGAEKSGVLLLLSMAERDYSLIAYGYGNTAFTDYGKDQLAKRFLDNFGEDDWYGGFADDIAACGRYLEANANGAPIDVEPSDETEEEYEPLSFGDKLFFAALMAFRFGLPLGLIVAFIVCAIYKRHLKSVRRATEAARYTVSGGAEITAREDRFTHTTEVRTPIKTESDDHDSGPSFSGGTTVNSGGFSHSGGKF